MTDNVDGRTWILADVEGCQGHISEDGLVVEVPSGTEVAAFVAAGDLVSWQSMWHRVNEVIVYDELDRAGVSLRLLSAGRPTHSPMAKTEHAGQTGKAPSWVRQEIDGLWRGLIRESEKRRSMTDQICATLADLVKGLGACREDLGPGLTRDADGRIALDMGHSARPETQASSTVVRILQRHIAAYEEAVRETPDDSLARAWALDILSALREVADEVRAMMMDTQEGAR